MEVKLSIGETSMEILSNLLATLKGKLSTSTHSIWPISVLEFAIASITNGQRAFNNGSSLKGLYTGKNYKTVFLFCFKLRFIKTFNKPFQLKFPYQTAQSLSLLHQFDINLHANFRMHCVIIQLQFHSIVSSKAEVLPFLHC